MCTAVRCCADLHEDAAQLHDTLAFHAFIQSPELIWPIAPLLYQQVILGGLVVHTLASTARICLACLIPSNFMSLFLCSFVLRRNSQAEIKLHPQHTNKATHDTYLRQGELKVLEQGLDVYDSFDKAVMSLENKLTKWTKPQPVKKDYKQIGGQLGH